MAHWYPVYHNEDYEAEIQVGLYDQWLQQLPFGPSQADRVLVHTDMMELADERRFAVCQARIDVSRFEYDHGHRVKQAVDHLQSRFLATASREPDDFENHQDEALIGLAPTSSRYEYTDCSQFTTCLEVFEDAAVQVTLSTALRRSQVVERHSYPALTKDAIKVDTDDDDEDITTQTSSIEKMIGLKRKSSHQPLDKTRQYKIIRYKKSAPGNKKEAEKGEATVPFMQTPKVLLKEE